MRHRGVCSACYGTRQRFDAGQAPGGRQHTSWSTSQRRATESSEPYVITALAQRWSGLFSHSAANAVVQLKSKCALNAFIATTAPRTQMICNSVLVEKTL